MGYMGVMRVFVGSSFEGLTMQGSMGFVFVGA